MILASIFNSPLWDGVFYSVLVAANFIGLGLWWFKWVHPALEKYQQERFKENREQDVLPKSPLNRVILWLIVCVSSAMFWSYNQAWRDVSEVNSTAERDMVEQRNRSIEKAPEFVKGAEESLDDRTKRMKQEAQEQSEAHKKAFDEYPDADN